ncbi:hypothetical protein [Pedobacter sp.]|uniref:hypothetical protein n=1 Tax=Pedobacter sp. TaxID=1411316 RepID=UPI003BAD9BAF
MNYSYKINKEDYIGAAFTHIPGNAIINKGRCGIGGTTMELKDDRNSIIVVPNTPTIESKKQDFKNICGVYGNIQIPEIVKYIEDKTISGEKLKFMSTPDSFYKIIEASKVINYNIKDKAFLLMDESHSVVTEGKYRERIAKPYDYFFDFTEKSIMSATPYHCSDRRFESLKKIDIEFDTVSNNRIKVVLSNNIISALKTVIENVLKDGNNAHVFYQSVVGFVDLINLIGNEHVSIFCSDSQDNRENLGDFSGLIANIKSNHVPNSVNLYTSKYSEGWDLHDKNAVIILVSNVSDTKTCFNIENKGVQSIGRLRNSTPKAIIHITNTNKLEGMELESKERIASQVKQNAERMINYYNETNNLVLYPTCKHDFLTSLKPVVESYANFNYSGDVFLNDFKLDAEINKTYSLAQYVSSSSIVKAWSNVGYEADVEVCDEVFSTKEKQILNSMRTAKKVKNKIILNKIHEIIQLQKSAKTIGKNYFESAEEDKLLDANPELVKLYNALGYDRMVELKFNLKAMKAESIIKLNTGIEFSAVIMKLLDLKFNPFNFYPSAMVKEEFSKIYRDLGLPKTGKGSDILKYYHAEIKTKWTGKKAEKCYLLKNKKYIVN